VCRASTNSCDAEEVCDGTSSTCPPNDTPGDVDGDTVCDAADNCRAIPNPGQANADGDALGDACDACTNVVPTVTSKAKLTMTRLLAPAGDDKVKFKGTVSGVPTSPAIDPVAHGVRFLVTDASGTALVDAIVPGGASWRTNGSTSWSYREKVSPVAGIGKITLKSRAPGEFKFVISGRDGAYLAPTGAAVTATLVLDPPLADSGQCGEATYPGCRILGGGAKLLCK